MGTKLIDPTEFENVGSPVTEVVQQAELGQMIDKFNEDIIDAETNQSTMDMKGRIDEFQLSSCLVHDTLVSMGILPIECLALTRQMKRLSVSLHGRGREELVEAITGQRMRQEDPSGFKGFLSKFGFGGNNEPK